MMQYLCLHIGDEVIEEYRTDGLIYGHARNLNLDSSPSTLVPESITTRLCYIAP